MKRKDLIEGRFSFRGSGFLGCERRSLRVVVKTLLPSFLKEGFAGRFFFGVGRNQAER